MSTDNVNGVAEPDLRLDLMTNWLVHLEKLGPIEKHDFLPVAFTSRWITLARVPG